eukprot:365861-Chlamydomonas_euryale.AAC.45
MLRTEGLAIVVRQRQHNARANNARTKDAYKRCCFAPDNIVLVELLEEADFAYSRGWYALFLLLQANLLERINFTGVPVASLVHNPIGSFSNSLQLFVLPCRYPVQRSEQVNGDESNIQHAP